MRTIETKAYTFTELSNEAKERARDWYRDGDSIDLDTWTYREKLESMGFEGVKIYYSGFWSQGDGACFEGTLDNDGLLKFLTYHKMLAQFPKIVRSLKRKTKTVNDLYVSIKIVHGGGHYHHEYMTNTEDNSELQDNGSIIDSKYKDEWMKFFEFFDCRAYGGDDGVQNAYRKGTWVVNMNKEIYRGLEAEYEYQNSDECVDINLIASEYEFTSEGERI